MTEITTEHGGQTVTYDRNDDTWKARSLSLKAMTLTALKTKIDAELIKLRRLNNVPALSLPYDGSYYTEPKHVVLNTIDKEAAIRPDNAHAWGFSEFINRRGTAEKARAKYKIGMLAPDTWEAAEKVAAWKRAAELSKLAREDAKTAYEAIPRLTLAELQHLAAEGLDAE